MKPTLKKAASLAFSLIFVAGVVPVLDSADNQKAIPHRKLKTGDAMETCTLWEPRPITQTLGQNDTLYFSYAVEPEASRKSRATFHFSVTLSEGGKSTEIFSQNVDPGRRGRAGGWKNAEISLAKFAGRTVTLEFSAKPVDEKMPREKADKATLWGGVRIGDFTRKPGEYNIIFISFDTTRADRLSITGYHRPTSPNLDAWAKESVYFRKAVTQGPFTIPAHMSVFTGLYPSYHGMMAFKDLAPLRKRELSAHVPVITEAIREHGYLTHAVTGSGFLSSIFGYYRGFDRYIETSGQKPSDVGFVMGRGMGWLDRHKDKRFFLFLHTYEVHDPYLSKYFTDPKQDKIENLNARYDGDLHRADTEFGKLRKKLEELKLLDDTLIVIFSDHGEELGERGDKIEHAHGDSVFEELVRVLLIFHLPGQFKPQFVTGRLVRLVDIAPTVFDFLGIPYQKVDPFGPTPKTPTGPAAAHYLFQGDSLLPFLRGDRGVQPSEEYVLTEGMEFGNERKALRRTTPKSDEKMIYHKKKGKYVMYDLDKDPKEHNPVDPKNYPELFDKMKSKIMAYLAGTPDPRNLMGSETEIDPSLAETLKSLGY